MSYGLVLQRCEWTSLVGTVLFAQGLGRMSTRGRTPQCIVGDRRHDGGGGPAAEIIMVIYGCIVVCMCQQTAVVVVVVVVAARAYNKGG